MLLVTLVQCTVVASFLLVTLHGTQGNQLGEYIKHFDPLSYDSLEVHQRHLRTKRSFYDKVINLPLSFNNRKFDLILYPADDGIFHPDAKISIDGSESTFDNSHLFNGHVKGDHESSVSGSIINGVFQGMIRTGSKDVFYVDKKEYHPSHPLTKDERVHSVIYHKEDVDTEKFNELRRAKRGANSGFCGLKFDDVAKRMADMEATGQEFQGSSERKKRAVPTKNTCNLFLQSDPEMWKHFKTTLRNAEDSIVTQEISALFNDLVKEVDGIFKNTDFNGKAGFRFRVDRLAINKTCGGGSNQHWFCNQEIDVGNFLNLNTYTEHNAYCLAYILTYRDFADGTLGLAWVAKAGSRFGGICSKYVPYSEAGSTRKKSLNTGIVTVKNYGERVPKLMSQLTLAHEIGHNFGSEHDSAGRCTPYTVSDDEKGNYIMYYAAISGKRPNNHRFSDCSITNMSKVLDNSINVECFKESTGSWCGNQLREAGEQCDCGYDADCPIGEPDCCRCCVGQNSNANDNGACKLKNNTSTNSPVTCDPSQGPCCAPSCGYQTSSVLCKPATECASVAMCDGTSVACPTPTPNTNKTACNGNTQVCIAGECSGSICLRIGSGDWTECSVSSADTSADALCAVSCADSAGACYSSHDTAKIPQEFKDMLNDVNRGDSIRVQPGQMCDKDQGFCDHFSNCRKVTDLGPLARLKGLLLSLTSTEELVAWLKVYWWVVLLSLLGLIAFMALLVKFGTVFTPSSNPEKDEARKITKPFTRPSNRRAAGPMIGGRQRDEIEMT